MPLPFECTGDSPKIVGCMDLMRVQGRWGPAARMAYIRAILKSVTDVTGGEGLSKEAPNAFPMVHIKSTFKKIIVNTKRVILNYDSCSRRRFGIIDIVIYNFTPY